jgi:hypothetical protein
VFQGETRCVLPTQTYRVHGAWHCPSLQRTARTSWKVERCCQYEPTLRPTRRPSLRSALGALNTTGMMGSWRWQNMRSAACCFSLAVLVRATKAERCIQDSRSKNVGQSFTAIYFGCLPKLLGLPADRRGIHSARRAPEPVLTGSHGAVTAGLATTSLRATCLFPGKPADKRTPLGGNPSGEWEWGGGRAGSLPPDRGGGRACIVQSFRQERYPGTCTPGTGRASASRNGHSGS